MELPSTRRDRHPENFSIADEWINPYLDANNEGIRGR